MRTSWLALLCLAALSGASFAATIVIDPGHGGDDLGAVVKGRKEKDIALAVALKLRDRIKKQTGLEARLTREGDVYVPLDERVGQSLAWDGTLFVSLHVNQVRHRRQRGITVFTYGKQWLAQREHRRPSMRRRPPPLPPPPQEQAAASAKLAAALVRSLRSAGFRVDPPAKADYYVLKNPAIPSLLIELGYLSNPDESDRLIRADYQGRLADSLAAILVERLAAASAPEPRAAVAAAR